ncbi:MAG: transcriptional regulator, partial [Pedobacter sp.]
LVLEGVDRNGLVDHLAKQGIPSMIYYPVPAHRQQMFASFGSETTHLPVTDWLTERVVSLPIHTEMDEDQQQFIIKHVLDYIR